MSPSQPLFLPCLRASMGDRYYYTGVMTFSEIVARVQLAENIYRNRALNEKLQRDVTDRADDIAEYLLRQKQRFFNGIIVGLCEGEPEWYPIEVPDDAQVRDVDVPDSVKRTLGVLCLSGSEKLYALDGQHRVEGIRSVLQKTPTLASEEQVVIFVEHRETKQGRERTRRLFSTLNRYAKPVTLGEIIILDEDDAMAIVTRELYDKHPFLSRDGVLLIGKTKVISRSNARCWTSIQVLYEMISILILPREWSKKEKTRQLQRRPSDAQLRKHYSSAAVFVDLLLKHFKLLKAYADASPDEDPAGPHRHAGGGHLLFRPVGLLSIARAVREGMGLGTDQERLIRKIAKMPMQLSERPWLGLLWNEATHNMITRMRNQRIASHLMLHMAGVHLEDVGSSETELKRLYAAELNKSPNRVKLPTRV